MLKKCDDEDIVKIKVRKYFEKKDIVDETIEDPQRAMYEVFLEHDEKDTFLLCVTLYED